MSFTLENVVPWGRTLAEYRAMFALTDADLDRAIVGVGDGPASFNVEMARLGKRVISADPLYTFTHEQISQRIDKTYNVVMAQLRDNQDEFVWHNIPSVDALGEIRMGAMRDFLADFEEGTADGRYIHASLPILPFETEQFDLALCSHFLFLYSEQFSADFHKQAITELRRVAAEVRIFPLLELGSKRSRHLDEIVDWLGGAAEIVTVDYEFQRGGNQMLRIVGEA